MLPNVLYIDLSTESYEIKERKDLFEEYLGGVGVGIKLLFENDRSSFCFWKKFEIFSIL